MNTEERLRDALSAVRAQSRARPDGAEHILAALADDGVAAPPSRRSGGGLPARRRPWLPILAAGAAAAALVVAVVAVGLSRGDDDVEVEPAADALDHDAFVDRVLAECEAFYAAAPARRPAFDAPPEAFRQHAEQLVAAYVGTFGAFADVHGATGADREAVEEARRGLQVALAAARSALDAADAGDTALAFAELERARRAGEAVGFALAQAGAYACDPRGVTPTTA